MRKKATVCLSTDVSCFLSSFSTALLSADCSGSSDHLKCSDEKEKKRGRVYCVCKGVLGDMKGHQQDVECVTRRKDISRVHLCLTQTPGLYYSSLKSQPYLQLSTLHWPNVLPCQRLLCIRICLHRHPSRWLW